MNYAVTLLNDPYNSWVHIFPEGRVYQAEDLSMRFFKMGISKLILEPEKAPIVIPMFHSGMETVMREDRLPPQFFPSMGREIHIRFGDPIPFKVLDKFRERWEKVKEHPTKGDLREPYESRLQRQYGMQSIKFDRAWDSLPSHQIPTTQDHSLPSPSNHERT